MRRVAWIGLTARYGRFKAWLGEGEKCEIRICDGRLIVVGSGWRAAVGFSELGVFSLAVPVSEV